MLDALIHRQNREVPGAAEAPVEKHAVKIVEHPQIPIGNRVNTVDEIRAGQVQPLLGNFGIFKAKQRFRFGSQELFDCACCCCCHE